MNQPFSFWKNKRVLVTGHTGFKGAWLVIWLQNLGAEVTGISLSPNTESSIFTEASLGSSMDSRISDIRDIDELCSIVNEVKPEIVFHLAAQALVRDSYQNPISTFSSNVMGTTNILESLRISEAVKVAVMITTDKVYENKEWPWAYRENDRLGGSDPYSASKSACEIIVNSYRESFFKTKGIAIASARAGNVIGGGDWSKDRLIPDIIKSWRKEEVVSIRRPNAVRPWQHVLEPLSSYMVLAETLWQKPGLVGAYNFGPASNEAASVRDVVELAKRFFEGGEVEYGDGKDGPHESSFLTLDISKSQMKLGINPIWGLEKSVGRTIEWYKNYHRGDVVRELCELDIEVFERDRW